MHGYIPTYSKLKCENLLLHGILLRGNLIFCLCGTPVQGKLREDLEKFSLVNLKSKNLCGRIPGSRQSMQSYILTYSRLKRQNVL